MLIPEYKWMMLEAEDYTEQDIVQMLMLGTKQRLNALVDSIEEHIEATLQEEAEDDIDFSLGGIKNGGKT